MSSKTTVLKDKPRLHKKVLAWGQYVALPFLCKAFILVGFGYATVTILNSWDKVPAQAQGALELFVVLLVLWGATQKRGK